MRLAILGPTASGKSGLAVEIARQLGATVVNGDPFQAIEGLAIGTGQPSREEQGGVPHVGYGCLPLSTPLNPAGFGAQVRRWMSPLERVVLVTGSGLYLRGIWEQLDALPDVPPAIVAEVRRLHAVEGAPALHRRLAEVDPVRAAQLHPNDSSRIQRALALHRATGQRPSDLLSGVSRGVPEGWGALCVQPARQALRDRVARRVAAMIAMGWEEEVRQIAVRGETEALHRLRPLGYLDWLAGGDPAEIVDRIIQQTQAYAKRQTTWFRNQLPDVPLWDPDGEPRAAALSKLGLPAD